MKDRIELSKEEWNERVNGGTKEKPMKRKFKRDLEKYSAYYILGAFTVLIWVLLACL